MKVFDDVKEHRKILNLKVKCKNKWEKPPDDGYVLPSRINCTWSGELRVYKVTCVREYIHIS